jgi:hypothetical protein
LNGNRQSNIGFIQMNCGRATFLDARTQITREIESFLLPPKWQFLFQP